MMPNIQTVPWGQTKILFKESRLAKKDVINASHLVPPSFKNMQDSYIGLSKDGLQIVAVVPGKPDPFTAEIKPVTDPNGGVVGAIKSVLEQVANALKGRG